MRPLTRRRRTVRSVFLASSLLAPGLALSAEGAPPAGFEVLFDTGAEGRKASTKVRKITPHLWYCLLYTSDAADE